MCWLLVDLGDLRDLRSVSGSARAAGTFREQDPHPQVAGGQPDDGGLVQLGGDGGRQRQHLGQLVELAVLLLPPGPGGVLGLLLHPAPSSLPRSCRHVRAPRCHGSRCFQVGRPGNFLDEPPCCFWSSRSVWFTCGSQVSPEFSQRLKRVLGSNWRMNLQRPPHKPGSGVRERPPSQASAPGRV